MRIVTWNCCGGGCLQRAEELLRLEPDVIVLQECVRPEVVDEGKCLWFGENPRKGVGIVARNGYSLEHGPLAVGISHSVFPVVVQGPLSFHLLAVWSQPRPTYVRAMDAGITAYEAFLQLAPSMIAGDFNSHSRWDATNRTLSHTMLVNRLKAEFKLVSAYHAPEQVAAEGEQATFYWRWKEQQPFHIDYCFIPQAWAAHIREVTIGKFVDWQTKSDHRPLLVDIGTQ